MSDCRNTRLPEGFAEFLENFGLPCPPLPLSVLDGLERTDDSFFATDQRPMNIRPDTPEEMDAVLDGVPEYRDSEPESEEETSSEPEDGVKFAGFGLAGSGLQGVVALYLLDTDALRLCVSLPWNTAFGDPERESEELASAFRLAEVCQQCAAGRGRLRVFVGGTGCRWKWIGDDGELEGDDAESLLDCLEKLADDADGDAPVHMWMRV